MSKKEGLKPISINEDITKIIEALKKLKDKK